MCVFIPHSRDWGRKEAEVRGLGRKEGVREGKDRMEEKEERRKGKKEGKGGLERWLRC